MQKTKVSQERVIGFVNGKRVKTTAKKWHKIMEDPKNSVVFKEDNDVEPEVETRGYTEEEIKQSMEDSIDDNTQGENGKITDGETKDKIGISETDT